jgi:hypothetical protein
MVNRNLGAQPEDAPLAEGWKGHQVDWQPVLPFRVPYPILVEGLEHDLYIAHDLEEALKLVHEECATKVPHHQQKYRMKQKFLTFFLRSL